jgi:hypothetical protein
MPCEVQILAAEPFSQGGRMTLEEFLVAEAEMQTRRDANGNLLLPEDDDPADAELIPEELRE